MFEILEHRDFRSSDGANGHTAHYLADHSALIPRASDTNLRESGLLPEVRLVNHEGASGWNTDPVHRRINQYAATVDRSCYDAVYTGQGLGMGANLLTALSLGAAAGVALVPVFLGRPRWLLVSAGITALGTGLVSSKWLESAGAHAAGAMCQNYYAWKGGRS